jgi:crotonobetainyl-CoA:carnitine CoA-transferase CaiB-like acyl-CoA transferase
MKNFCFATMLQHVKILDLSRILAAPFATQLLADYGATVFKIEHCETGDDTRSWGPPFTAHGHESAYFLSVNRNKKSVAINLKHAEGVSLVQRLAQQCHVVVENFPSGKLASMGLGYEQLSKLNPSLVYCSVTGFGQDGPYRDKLAYDVMVSGVGGLLGVTGSREQPAKVGVAISDVCAGLYAHGSILAALLAKRGCHIDVSLLDTQIATLVNVASSYLVSNKIPQRMGTAHSSIVPYESFQAKDGEYLIAGALNDGQFVRLCTALEMSSNDPRFLSNELRVQHREVLIPLLKERFLQRKKQEWLDLLEQHRVPCGPINNLEQVFQDPQVVARRMRQTVRHSSAGSVDMVSPPVRFDGKQSDIRMPPPELGQHTWEVLSSELGLKREDYDRLVKAQAIGSKS